MQPGIFASGVRNPPDGLILLEEALALFRQIGDQWGICEALLRLGMPAFIDGRFEQAEALRAEAIKLARQAGDASVLSWTLFWAAVQSNPADSNKQRKTQLYQESLSLFRMLGFKNGMSLALSRLSDEAFSRGETEQAVLLLAQSLLLAHQTGKLSSILGGLLRIVEQSIAGGEAARAARLLGAMNQQISAEYGSGCNYVNFEKRHYEQSLDSTRGLLDDAAFAAAFAEGQLMSLEEAVAFALANMREVTRLEV